MKYPYITQNELENHFEFVLTLVERGQTFMIKTDKGNLILAPYVDVKPMMDVKDQLSSMLEEQLSEIPNI
ncbi:hypothetical protein SWPG_00150 [Synechococcus phage S-CBM2]|nr:hypothetical protein SWPG_00150 [Synechococcus phage S-CBM2]